MFNNYKYVKIAKEFTSILTKLVSITNSKIKTVRSNYIALVAKVIVKGKGKKDTESVGEDTQITIGVKDEIEEAFAEFADFVLEEDEASEEDIDMDIDDDNIEESALYKALCAYLG